MRLAIIVCFFLSTLPFSHRAQAESRMQFGFSKVDITPQVPVRLSGYGNRDQPYTGIDEPLFVRTMALTTGDLDSLHLLVAVETIGFPGELTQEIYEQVEQRYSIPRSRFVIGCTHSHTAPHIVRGLTNLFSTPQSEEELDASKAYTKRVQSQVLVAIEQAVDDLQPGRLFFGSGEVTFARNRRVLENGVWTGFGENPAGPVDHSLPLLRVTDSTGHVTRGLVFNYACHCTTFGGDYNRVNGDWAGYAAKSLEVSFPDAVALCTIGAGADANPQRDREHAFEIARQQGREIHDEVHRLLAHDLQEITIGPKSSFGFAGLPIDRPNDAQLAEALKSPRPQVRQHAEVMIETKKRMGRLPETYPMPIQVWRFGSQFCMVFLGGEVVVDYAHRIKRELPELDEQLDPQQVWVTAYANDVFGYVASERMQSEGGYEVDFSQIYYLQPGRWSAGTEEVVIRRVRELFESRDLDVPLSLDDAMKTFTLPEGFEIEVVAAEPLIRDPINFSVDAAGRLWVVEMGDYPRGKPDEHVDGVERHEPWDGPPGGTVKVLTDDDGDGKYDAAHLFLDGLTFPTGVFPWRDGVLISGAPDLIFARDTDGDFQCDDIEVLYSGFSEANPQHRVAGFEYGLDGWLFLSAGTNNREITCHKTGEVVNISGRDCRIHPDTGKLEPVSGRAQYGRCRDDFGNWYGNSNSEPLFQYVIEDHVLGRNPFVASPSPKHHLTTPAHAPPVYPTSRTVDRFNDLFALNRFTSACSPLAIRNQALGEDASDDLLICEPVHNLISRVVVDRSTIAFTGARHPHEQQTEFLSSTDNWFRPVRLMNAPDGSLWVCDMYRHVIEHPEWIPEAWQAKLNLYAGNDRGRIYRIFRSSHAPQRIEPLATLDLEVLIDRLGSGNAWTRDTAQRLILERTTANDQADVMARLAHLREHAPSVPTRIQLEWTRALLTKEFPDKQQLAASPHVELIINALRIGRVVGETSDGELLSSLASHESPRVRFELAIAAGQAPPSERIRILKQLITSDFQDGWIRAAILSSSRDVAGELLIHAMQVGIEDAEMLEPLLSTLLGDSPAQGMKELSRLLNEQVSGPLQQQLLLSALTSLERQRLKWEELQTQLPAAASKHLNQIIASSFAVLSDDEQAAADRARCIRLFSFYPTPQPQQQDAIVSLFKAQFSPEQNSAVIAALLRWERIDELLTLMKSQTPAIQAEIQAELLTRSAWTDRLFASLEQGTVSVQDLTTSTQQSLANHQREDVRTRFEKLASFQAAPPQRVEVLAAYESALALQGNSGRGEAVFRKTCAACHRHRDVGNDFGPQLATLKNKPNSYLLTAIFDPNAAVEAKYRGYAVAMRDGKVYSGLIREETATSLTLIRPDGKPISLLRSEIEEIASTGRSFMPEGLEKELTPQDVADVIAFLRLQD